MTAVIVLILVGAFALGLWCATTPTQKPKPRRKGDWPVRHY